MNRIMLLILNLLKGHVGTTGIERGKLLDMLYREGINPDIAKALINRFINEGLISVFKYGNDSYYLSEEGLLWIEEQERLTLLSSNNKNTESPNNTEINKSFQSKIVRKWKSMSKSAIFANSIGGIISGIVVIGIMALITKGCNNIKSSNIKSGLDSIKQKPRN